MREAYDETGSTDTAIELGLARTGKLVTSGALILMFAFLVLSTSPGYEIKPLAIGVAAGIIFDATVVRALLVPALMRLLGDANWWMPSRPTALAQAGRRDARRLAGQKPGQEAGRGEDRGEGDREGGGERRRSSAADARRHQRERREGRRRSRWRGTERRTEEQRQQGDPSTIPASTPSRIARPRAAWFCSRRRRHPLKVVNRSAGRSDHEMTTWLLWARWRSCASVRPVRRVLAFFASRGRREGMGARETGSMHRTARQFSRPGRWSRPGGGAALFAVAAVVTGTVQAGFRWELLLIRSSSVACSRRGRSR